MGPEHEVGPAEPSAARQRVSDAPTAQPGQPVVAARGGVALSTQGLLALQRSAGNQAVVQGLLERQRDRRPEAASGGLKSGVSEPDEPTDEVVGGRTVGEFFGDVWRPVGTFFGNVVGSVAGAVTGVRISTKTNSGPTWNNHGDFDWRVGFTTTARNGWIVQEVKNTWRATNTAGASVVPVYTPHYWEAWAVDGAGKVTPAIGVNNDYWLRPSRGNNTKGHWSMKGKVYFTKVDPATKGFVAGNLPGGVRDAGILLSTTTPGSGLGLGIARLHRYAQGTWDSTGAVKTHTGSAH